MSQPGSTRGGPSGAWWAAVAGVTLLALALRLTGFDQSLFGDELFTYDTARSADLNDLFREVRTAEVSPPGFFLITWVLDGVLGDTATAIRLPSLVLGTLAVPLTYLVGARTAGRGPGLLGAALLAVGPFAVWYADEARTYAPLLFFALLSTYALLRAVDARPGTGGGWWALLAISVAATLLCHYTGVFVLAAQLAWALWAHPGRRRALAAAYGAGVVPVLVWLPFAPGDNGAIDFLVPFTAANVLREAARAMAGQPFSALEDLPGLPALALVAVAGVLGVAGVVLAARRRELDRRLGLIGLLALATPAGLILYSLVAPSIYLGRNLTTALPFASLLVAAGLARLPRPAAVAGAVLASAGLLVGTARSLDEPFRRVAWDDAAAVVATRPGDRVVVVDPLPVPTPPGRRPIPQRSLEAALDRPRRVGWVPAGDRAALARAGGGRPLTAVVLHPRAGAPALPGYRVAQRRTFPGVDRLAVVRYVPA
ncbi:MAG TPA: glycosyltransferase family 39 protein [Solirubrobacteraceae bacterium]|nr:glycosyltransferase family 39 protein [Solirubrobacteraceae bacterium]